MRSFESLSEREVLALAIALEEEDGRIYGDYAEGLREHYPASADSFLKMRQEEIGHRDRLFELFRLRFGEHIPLIGAQDVRGFVKRRRVWLNRPLGLNVVRKQAAEMESASRQFYEKAAQRTSDLSLRQLLNSLADEERGHLETAERLDHEQTANGTRAVENDQERRLFVMQIVQPGLAGLDGGSVRMVAPVVGAAFC